jgi:hypothetical protein
MLLLMDIWVVSSSGHCCEHCCMCLYLLLGLGTESVGHENLYLVRQISEVVMPLYIHTSSE